MSERYAALSRTQAEQSMETLHAKSILLSTTSARYLGQIESYAFTPA